MSARQTLIDELREHALVIGEVTLTSGRKAGYLIDAKRAILRPAGFTALAELTAAEARQCGAQAVGGITMGADPIACAALAGGADVDAFFVRKERKEHGLSRWIEGPLLVVPPERTSVQAGETLGEMIYLLGNHLSDVISPLSGVVLFTVTSPAIKRDGLLLSVAATS